MDGRTLGASGVAAIKGYGQPIEIARKVMETTPHVLRVGAGAELFAERHGFERAELVTPEAEAVWRERLLGGAPTANSIVRAMRDGFSVEDALRRAMLDLRDMSEPQERPRECVPLQG